MATVDLGAVRHNAGVLSALAARDGAQLCAVVKADGYGLGAVPCARAALAGGATRLAVATVAEAVALRDAGIGVPLLVLGPLARDELDAVVAFALEVQVWSAELLAALARAGEGAAAPVSVHLKLDSGMGRLGVRDAAGAAALAAAVAATPGVRLAGISSHFATADDDLGTARVQLARQQQLMRAVAAALPLGARPLRHVANSAAAFALPQARLDLVRAGIALYGADPFHRDARERGLRPVLRLCSAVAALRELRAGDGVGYGHGWRAIAPARVATVALGYADGLPRAAGAAARVLVGGVPCPLAGRVSMDAMAVDVTGVPGVEVGDEVVLIGAQGGAEVTVEQLAAASGTISYELLVRLGRRVERRYRGSA